MNRKWLRLGAALTVVLVLTLTTLCLAEESTEETGEPEGTAEETTAPSTEETTEPSTEETTAPSAEESSGESREESTEESGGESREESTEESGGESREESTEESGGESREESTEESGGESQEESTEESAEESTEESTEAGEDLGAVFEATGYSCGTLSGLTEAMEWSLDGENWTPAGTNPSEEITGLTENSYTLQVRLMGEEGIQFIRITRAQPALSAMMANCGGHHGAINNVTIYMVYAYLGRDLLVDVSGYTEDMAEMVPVTADQVPTIAGPTVGAYVFIEKAHGTTLSSAPVRVQVRASTIHNFGGGTLCVNCGYYNPSAATEAPTLYPAPPFTQPHGTEAPAETAESSEDSGEASTEESCEMSTEEESSSEETETAAETETETETETAPETAPASTEGQSQKETEKAEEDAAVTAEMLKKLLLAGGVLLVVLLAAIAGILIYLRQSAKKMK